MGSSGWSTDKLERADDVAADVGEAQPGSRLSPDCGLLHFNLDWGGRLVSNALTLPANMSCGISSRR